VTHCFIVGTDVGEWERREGGLSPLSPPPLLIAVDRIELIILWRKELLTT
jgi:hypothetical protein